MKRKLCIGKASVHNKRAVSLVGEVPYRKRTGAFFMDPSGKIRLLSLEVGKSTGWKRVPLKEAIAKLK